MGPPQERETGIRPDSSHEDERMFHEVKKSIQWGSETLTLETGKIARQADG